MRMAGLSDKGGARVITRKPKGPDLRPDLVNREFKAPGPGKLWVADITHACARKGFVYNERLGEQWNHCFYRNGR